MENTERQLATLNDKLNDSFSGVFKDGKAVGIIAYAQNKLGVKGTFTKTSELRAVCDKDAFKVVDREYKRAKAQRSIAHQQLVAVIGTLPDYTWNVKEARKSKLNKASGEREDSGHAGFNIRARVMSQKTETKAAKIARLEAQLASVALPAIS